MTPLNGIHHITALASDPQKNIDFYAGFLGLRLVKKTVNFDAPDVYHFYYGDETGRPGTVLTFFPFPDATKGRRGVGEATGVAFSILPDSMAYWIDRLAQHAIHFDGPSHRFDEDVIAFEDPDGMMIELVANPAAGSFPVWNGSAADAVHAPRAFYGATFAEAQHDITAKLLTETMGFRFGQQEGERYRYLIGSGETEAKIDILAQPTVHPGRQSAGSVHHIAWRVATDEGQLEWQRVLSEARLYVTSVQDRQYFHSIYFREPGGVLFEIATDGPGMLIDESLSELGTRLKLPPWFEARRERIEQQLIPVKLPAKKDSRQDAKSAREV